MIRFLRFFAALCLLPFCGAAALALVDLFIRFSASGEGFSAGFWWFLGGHIIWLAVWFFLPRPMRVYVLGHELTYALWGLLFGARVRNLKVSARGGSVQLTKSNLLITLAPYFFPFYTMVLLLAWGITACFVKPVPYPFLWLFGVGLTWSFHLCFTIHSLTLEQPDVQEYGRLFSYVVIFVMNLLCVGVWLVCVSDLTWAEAGRLLYARTLDFYVTLYIWLRLGFRRLIALLR